MEKNPSQFKIGSYIAITPITIENLKRAVFEYGAILVGFIGSNEGWRNKFIRPPQQNENQWGHACIAVGWTKEYIIAQNSWGSDWADNGLFYFNENYLPFSAWAVLIDLPNNWKDLLPNPDDKPKHFFANNLFQGLRNEDVRALQDCYKWLGVMPKEVTSTGYFGSTTLQSTKLFQERYGILPVSGFVGIITRQKLNELFA